MYCKALGLSKPVNTVLVLFYFFRLHAQYMIPSLFTTSYFCLYSLKYV